MPVFLPIRLSLPVLATDWEINLGLDNDIFCFNVESAVELEIINELAAAKNKVASIALRINPEVDAHTHAKITTV